MEQLELWLYQMQQTASQWTAWELQRVSIWSLAVMVGAGILSSLSPCMLSMLPVMVGYVGGYGSDRRTKGGLALGLCLWGVLVGSVTLLMGLNLLEVVSLPLPNLVGDVQISERVPAWLRAYGIGLLFGVTASPCSTPVLVAILAWVSQSRDPWLGGLLLLTYALGLMLPLLLVGFFTGLLTQLLALRRWSGSVTWLSGLVLVVVGTLTLVQPVLSWFI